MTNKVLLLVLCFVITGCTMDCVEPGLQTRETSVSVDVPVNKDSESVKIQWVDSGQVISKEEKIRFSVDGSISFCPGQEPVQILVPAIFCSDGSEPNYEKAKDLYSNNPVSGLDAKEVCGGKGFGAGDRRYVDTGIKVNPGNKLNFDLVPRKMNVDCNKLQDVTLDENCYKTDSLDDKQRATPKEICRGGEFFCTNIKGERVKHTFNPSDKKEGKNLEYKLPIGKTYTPYDNKVDFFNSGNSKWIDGALLDLRKTNQISLDKLCEKEYEDKKQECINDRKKNSSIKFPSCEEQAKIAKQSCKEIKKKKYSIDDLNCYYNNICYGQKGLGSSCISSVRYKEYEVDNKCNMYSYLRKVEQQVTAKKDLIQDEGLFSWATGLIAKIDHSDEDYTNISYNKRNDMSVGSKGSQCLPSGRSDVCTKIGAGKDFKDFSLELNHDYKVNDDVKPGSSLMLAIVDNNNRAANRGGYHVKVSRSCNFSKGERLYVYLGSNPPQVAKEKLNKKLGKSDEKTESKDVYLVNDKDELKALEKKKEGGTNDYLYTIDGSSLNSDENQKIYFGIDVTDVEVKELNDKDGKYNTSNKYILNLKMKRKLNDFISSSVNIVINFIKDTSKSAVKDAYQGYKKGLIQTVRALLTLYVIFSVVGYMLGTVQLSKHDFIVRITKIAFIVFAFSDKSWELFGDELSKFFIEGSSYLINSFSGYIGPENKSFAFLDLTAGMIFTWETWLKFLSLIFSGPFGFIAFLLVISATFKFLGCLMKAILSYMVAIILGGFLLSLTPIFIVFILFQQTKPLFDNWIKTLAHVALQPVILFSSLSLLNQLMYSVLYNLTNFSACYQCIVEVNITHIGNFCIFRSMLPVGHDSSGSGGSFVALPIDLVQAFTYMIIASAMQAFASAAEIMTQSILQSGYGVTEAIGKIANSASQAALSTVGLDDNTQNMIQRVKGMQAKKPNEIDFKNKSPSDGDEKDSKSDEERDSKQPVKDESMTESSERFNNPDNEN